MFQIHSVLEITTFCNNFTGTILRVENGSPSFVSIHPFSTAYPVRGRGGIGQGDTGQVASSSQG